jgi:hypothetical protein
MTAAEQAMVKAAREAASKGESIKPAAFKATNTKAGKSAYLQGHL